jgi:hypothetical protein
MKSRNQILLLCFAAATAHATSVTWLGGPGIYTDATMWSTGIVPENGSPLPSDTYDVVVDGGSMTLDTSVTLASFALSTAEMDVSGTQTLAATTTFGPGSVVGGGILNLSGPSTASAGNVDLYLNLNGGAKIVNSGSFTHAVTGGGATAIVLDADGVATGSIFENTAAGTFTANTATGDGSIGYGAVNAGNVFLNEGTFTKTGAHDYAANVAFQNSGTVNIQQGALHLNGGDGSGTTGGFAISSGATLAIGSTVHFASGSSVSGAGSLEMKSGLAEFASGSVMNAAGLQILSGTVDFKAGSTLGNNNQDSVALTMNGGALQLDIDHTFTAASFSSNGTVTGTGHVTFAGATTLGAGSYVFGGAGVKEFSGAATFATSATSQYFNINGSGAEVSNAGTFTQSVQGAGDNEIVLNADSTGGGSIFLNSSTGTFTANTAGGNGGVGFAASDAGNRFTNQGSFVKTGTGTYAFNVGLTNDGTASVQQGTLNVNSGGSASGSFSVSSGATLGLNGTFDFNSAGSVLGAGSATLNGGTTTFHSGSSFSAAALNILSGTMVFQSGSTFGPTSLSASGGLLEVDIDHTFTSPTLASGAAISGSGATTFAGTVGMNGASVTFSGSGTKTFSGTTTFTSGAVDSFFNVAGGTQVSNTSSFTQTRDSSGLNEIVLNSDLAGGTSVFRNASGATFTAATSGGDGGVVAGAVSSGNSFLNQGTFVKSGAHNYAVNVAFANSGTVNVQGGGLNLLGGDGGSTTGTMTIASGATTTLNGGFTFGSGAAVSGSGTLLSAGGATTFGSGSSFSASALQISGGTVDFAANSTLGTTALSLTGGTLQLDIAHTFTSPTLGTGAVISGSGATTLAGPTSLSGVSVSFSGTGTKIFSGLTTFTAGAVDSFLNVAGGAEVRNTGTFTQTRNSTGLNQIVLNSDLAGGSSVFRNASSATFSAVTTGGDSGVGAGAASSGNVFINQGTFMKSGSHNYIVNTAFANSGSVSVQAGALNLLGGDGGSTTGTMTIASGATTTLNGGFTFGSPATVSGSGTLISAGGTTTFGSGSDFSASALQISGGTTAFAAGSTLGTTALTMTGGTLQADIDHTFSGASLGTGAAISGAGNVSFSSPAAMNGEILTFSGAGTKSFSGTTTFTSGAVDSFLNVAGGGKVSNTGSFTQTRDSTGLNEIVLNSDQAGGSSVFQNAAGATFTAATTGGDGSVAAGAASSGNLFLNQGSFVKTGSHDFIASIPFENVGSIDVQQGGLSLLGGDGGSSAGTMSIQTGSRVTLSGGFSFWSGSSVSGPGTLVAAGGTTIFHGGSFTASTLQVTGGVLVFLPLTTIGTTALSVGTGDLYIDVDHTFTGATLSDGAMIDGNGVVTFNDTVGIGSASVTFAGSGMKTFSGTTTFSPGVTDGFLNIQGGGELVNSGTFTQKHDGSGASAIVLGSDGNPDSTLRNTGTFIADISSGMATVGYGVLSTQNQFINSGTFTKTGGGVYQVNVVMNNSGSIHVANGTLAATAGITNSLGTVTTDPGTALDLAQNVHTSTIGTLIQNGAMLQMGSNDVTIASDYQNANFGSGNAFNGRANVFGTGKILAAGDTALAYKGAASSGSVNFGTVHVGDVVTDTYSIQNTGTTGAASVRGAFQTTAVGANITDSRLSGTGITAADFGQLAPGASSANRSITFTASTPGALSGQQLHVATNFDNVTMSNLTIQGTANYYATPQWDAVSGSATLTKLSATSYTLSFGTVSNTSGMLAMNLDLSNQLLSALYQDSLGGTFDLSGVSHFTLSGFSTFNGITSGSSLNGLSVDVNPASLGNGAYSETLVLNPSSTNTSGTSSLSAIQLTLQVTVVPEPCTTLLLLAGLGLCLGIPKLARKAHSAK